MKTFNRLIKRLLIIVIPLLALYVFTQKTFGSNRQSAHPVDAGMGIAILLMALLVLCFIGFTIDLIKRIVNKDRAGAIIDAVFLVSMIICM